MRTSDYTIIVDLPEDGQSLLVHGYTGAFDVVQEHVAGFLRQMCGPSDDHAPSTVSPDTLAILHQRGYLTGLTSEQEQARVARLAELLILPALYRQRVTHAASSQKSATELRSRANSTEGG